MIKIDNLVKKYDRNIVLSIDDVTIGDCDVVGLVGNNGAGKTTLMNILAGIINPSSGECTIDNKKPYVNLQCSDKIAIIDEKMSYCGNTRLNKILEEMHNAMSDFNYEKSKELLLSFGLNGYKHYKHLSKGMKNIFNMIVGFSLPHKIILFDEITSGLDEFARLKFGELLAKEIIDNPKTYILSTHLFGEISSITEKVILLKKGKLEYYDTVDNLSYKLVSLRGQSQDINQFMKGKTIYMNKMIGNYREVVTLGNLTRHDKIFLQDNGIELIDLPVSQICAIMCGCDNSMAEV